MLQNTASSVNIKERLDFSCAVFDGDGPSGRQRAAHAGASRLDGPLGGDDHPPQRGRHPSRRRVRPQRALQRRHPPARHHRLHAGLRRRRARRGRRRRSSFWVASRGHHADIGGIGAGLDDAARDDASRRKASSSTISGWSNADASARRSCAPPHRPSVAGAATSPRTSPTSGRRSPPTRRACTRSRAWSSTSASTWSTRLYGPRPGQRRGERAPRDRRAARFRVCRRRPTRAPTIKVKITRRPRQARGDGRLHRHQPRAADQLQRARAGDPRGGALLLPRHGGRAPIPMNAGCLRPINIVIPEGSMLSPRYPAAVVAGNVETAQQVDQLPVRGARRDGRRAGHDEQPHLRQRPGSSTTRRSAPARRPALNDGTASTAPTPSTPT